MVPIKRSYPAPTCLANEATKKSGDYKCGDVLDRLQQDFFTKCYICEEKYITAAEVEHLRPHQGDRALKYDWENLFWSCRHCNNTKSNRYQPMLDCTQAAVDRCIRYDVVPYPSITIAISAEEKGVEIDNTVQLLLDVYVGKTHLKKLESQNLRQKLSIEWGLFLSCLKNAVEDESVSHQEALNLHLHNSSPFAAFKRWKI
ncbi:MAG: HNH endonuclease [Mariprofundaceae bacterium]|nr:HNH endonuclease [Mariprofundaceae bacterium]